MGRPDPRALAGRVRRAYEMGRLRAAVARAWPVAPMLGVSLALCDRTDLSALSGAALVALAVAMHWSGGILARAVRPGLGAGLAPLLLPLLARSSGTLCVGGTCVPICLLSCAAGGLIASGVLGLAARRLVASRPRFFLAGAAVALLAGAMGCAVAGGLGLAGLAAGAIAGSAPVLALAPARRD